MERKILNKRFILLSVVVGIAAFLLVNVSVWNYASANQQEQSDLKVSHENGYTHFELGSNDIRLDKLDGNSEKSFDTDGDTEWRSPENGPYTISNGDGVRRVHLFIQKQFCCDTLGYKIKVCWKPICEGWLNDVNSKYTIVAVDRDGKILGQHTSNDERSYDQNQWDYVTFLDDDFGFKSDQEFLSDDIIFYISDIYVKD